MIAWAQNSASLAYLCMERAATADFAGNCEKAPDIETLKMMHVEVLMMAQFILSRMRGSRKEDNRRRLVYDVASWILIDRICRICVCDGEDPDDGLPIFLGGAIPGLFVSEETLDYVMEDAD